MTKTEDDYDCKFLFTDNEIETTLSIESDIDSDEGGYRLVIGEIVNRTFNYTTPICINRYIYTDEETSESTTEYEVRTFNLDDNTLGDIIYTTNEEIENAIINNRLYCVQYNGNSIICFYNVNNFVKYDDNIIIEWILYNFACSTYSSQTIGLIIRNGIISQITHSNS